MIRILHISDLHASASRTDDLRVLVDAMLRDVATFAQAKPVDLVAFSGDLVDRGRAEEFVLAKKVLFEPLLEHLEIGPERIILVPGNHDVDRGRIPEFIERGLVDSLTNREQVNQLLDSSDSVRQACQRLQDWAEFHDDFYEASLPAQPGPLGYVHRFELDGHSVGVAALNSAWRSSSREDKGRLLLGTRQVTSALDSLTETDVRIVVMHHPLNWLAPFDAEQVQAEFENRGVIVLSGHEHKAEPATRRSPYGEILQLSTGSLYLNRDYPNSYEIVDVDIDDGRVFANFRRWQRMRTEFDADLETAAEGREEFDLPTADRRKSLGHPRFSTVMRSIAETAQALMPEELAGSAAASTIEDVMIEPHFLDVPFEAAEAMAAFATAIPAEEIDPFEGPNEEDEAPEVIIVAGPSRAGVSRALLWLLAKAYRQDVHRMPSLLRARDSGLGTAKTAASLAKASAMFGHRQSDSRDPDLHLGIDDFACASPRKQDLLLEFMRTNRRHRYIIGCDEDWAEGLGGHLEDAGLRYRLVFLGPLESHQVHLLGSAMNSAPSDVERVDEALSKHGLPRNPPTAIALIAVAQRHPEPDLSERSFLEGYVNFLLDGGCGSGVQRLEMSPRQRAHLLGELAHVLREQPDYAMRVINAEIFLVDYFSRKGLQQSASEVLRALVSCSVLVEDSERVSFRDHAVLNFFMGHWMLEDPRNKAEALADCIGNAEMIRHAAELKRDDEEILSAVGACLQQAIEAAEPLVTRGRVDKMLGEVGATGCWKPEKLGQALSLLPPRQMVAAIDAQADRIVHALGLQPSIPDEPAFAIASQLNAAVSLLSDVLKSSELVDNVGLKQEMLERAISGWVLLIGLLISDDASGESFRSLMNDFIAERLAGGKRSKRQPAIPHSMVAAVVLFVVMISVQGRLGCRSLSTITEACLNNDEFVDSQTAKCLLTWLHAHIGTAGWARRLGELLETLPVGSLMRDATLATAAHLYRSSPGEPEVRELEPILVEDITSVRDRWLLSARRREQQRRKTTKRWLQQSRREYQQWHHETNRGLEVSSGEHQASQTA